MLSSLSRVSPRSYPFTQSAPPCKNKSIGILAVPRTSSFLAFCIIYFCSNHFTFGFSFRFLFVFSFFLLFSHVILQKKLQNVEDLVDGIDNIAEAFIGMISGDNVGRRVNVSFVIIFIFFFYVWFIRANVSLDSENC
jgi:hypothetical protein